MIETKLILHMTRLDGNPAKSGTYMAFFESRGRFYSVQSIPYSAKHGIWNAEDSHSEEKAAEFAINDVAAWAEIPEANAPEGSEEDR